jgi:hypothetical protein
VVERPAGGTSVGPQRQAARLPRMGGRHDDVRRPACDPGPIWDFHSSGPPDLATYTVSDNLGAVMALRLTISILAALFGLVATVAAP